MSKVFQIYVFIFLFPFYSQAQFGKLGNSLKKKFEETVNEKLESKNEQFETNSFNYAIAFLDKSESFENKQQGENIFKAVNYLRKNEDDITDRDQAVESYELGRIAYLNRKYKFAEGSLLDAINSFENLDKDDDPVMLKSIGLLGLLYSDMGQFNKALLYTQGALSGWNLHYGKQSKGYAAEYNNLAVLHLNIGDYSAAEKEIKEAHKLIASAEGEKSMPSAIVLNNQAILTEYLGRSDEALSLVEQSLSIAGDELREKSGVYLQLMTNKALMLQKSANYERSESTYLEAIDLQKSRLKLKRASDADYAHMLNNLASLYFITGKIDEAEELLKESLLIFESKFGSQHPLVATAKLDLGNIYRVQGKLEIAETLIGAATSTMEATLGKEHPKTTNSREYLALLKWKQGRITEAQVLYKSVMNETVKYINSYFPPLSEAEKTKYWELLKPRFFRYYNFAFENCKEYPALLQDAINYRFSTKGLLLSSTTKIKNDILKSDDVSLIKLYGQWTDTKKELATYYSYTKDELAEQKIDLKKLELDANALEKMLSERSSSFSKSFVAIDINYEDAIAKIGIGEGAVEIVHYPYFENVLTQKMKYAALILTKGNAVKLVVLDNGNELDTKYYKSYKNSIRLKIADETSYKQFWKPIESSLIGLNKVYVSLDGVYNQLNLNTLRLEDGKYLIENRNLQILGNLSDLVKTNSAKRQSKSATLIGFPTYNSATIASLPGTAKEVSQIGSVLKSNQYLVNILMENEASENKIKAVKSPYILHIATHGYFKDDISATSSNVFGVQVEHAENNPLLRSGLLLAGASDEVNQNVFTTDDNGILTAYEALNLSLEETELVVLSACETGKGDIKSGDGVYGLQRAFTVAGTNQLIMSLWKVDDAATQALMSSFYNNWIVKKFTVDDAFRKAQLDLMKIYKEPYYWGAFVHVK
jgi:CHAT domain-containing protein